MSEVIRSRHPAVLALLLVLVLPWALLVLPERWLERHYAHGLYPLLASLIIPVTDALPFSLMLLSLPLLPLALGFMMVTSFRRRKHLKGWALAWGIYLLLLSLGLYGLFLITWGGNYRRPALEARLGLDARAPAQEEMLELAQELLGRVQRDSVQLERDREEALLSLRRSLLSAVESWEGRQLTLPLQVKRPPPGWLLLFGVSGSISPWTLEAHVDGALPDYKFLAVAVHELAHLAGYGSEAETDFVAAVAGLQADHPFARYSVSLSLLESVAWRLPAHARAELLAALPQEARDDLQRMREVRARHHSPFAGLQAAVYDRYLRAQGVQEGVADYGRMLNLLTAAARAGWLNEQQLGP